jgi:cation diffusion facilitator CzcD-associated flavoprotein CzcO
MYVLHDKRNSIMNKNLFKWAVVGAGPAGIAAVVKLIDEGINAEQILWVDPEFKVGDLGRHWPNVSSNTTVQRFLDFFDACKSIKVPTDFPLFTLPKEETCRLNYMVEPLQWMTNRLLEQVTSVSGLVDEIHLANKQWHLTSAKNTYCADKVILAQGASPKYLNHKDIETIPFEVAIDSDKLQEVISKEDTIAVFGSSHSAIMIVNYLVNLGAKRVINFYQSPCRYAVNMGDWILFDNTGLKGKTADFARQFIDGTLPNNVERYLSNTENLSQYLPVCNKAIDAVGFETRSSIKAKGYNQLNHNPHVGIIAPGLFGLGIAYPEIKADPFGQFEHQVGIWKFMSYITKVMPLWMKYPG